MADSNMADCNMADSNMVDSEMAGSLMADSNMVESNVADSKKKPPEPWMKNLHVARYKAGRPRCLLLHAEGVDKKMGARYDRFEMLSDEMQTFPRSTADYAVFIKTLGLMPEVAGRLESDCETVAKAANKKSDQWIDDIVLFLRSSNDPVYRHIV